MTRKTLNFEVNPLLSGPSLDARSRSGSPFRYIPVSDIDLDPDQPRRVFDEQALNELAESIKTYGVLSPVLVSVSAGGTYRLISGERRLRACKLISLEAIPAIVDYEDDDQETIFCKQIVENLQREDLSPMERALAIGQLRERFSLSVREISRRLGLSKSNVQRSLDVLALPDDLQAALIAGASESKVLLLKQVEDRESRRELIANLEELNREDLEIRISKLLTEKGVSHRGTVKKPKTKSKLSAADQRIVDEIQHALGTKAKLIRSGSSKQRGKLVLEFYSEEDLHELHRRMLADS